MKKFLTAMAVILAVLCVGCASGGEKGEKAPAPQNEEIRAELLTKVQELEALDEKWQQEEATQQEMNTASQESFQKWEALRQEILAYVKQGMDAEAISALETAETAWEQTREAEQDASAAQWGDGSGASMAYHIAGSSATREHCYALLGETAN